MNTLAGRQAEAGESGRDEKTVRLGVIAIPQCRRATSVDVAKPDSLAEVCPGYCHSGWLAYCTGGREAARPEYERCMALCRTLEVERG